MTKTYICLLCNHREEPADIVKHVKNFHSAVHTQMKTKCLSSGRQSLEIYKAKLIEMRIIEFRRSS